LCNWPEGSGDSRQEQIRKLKRNFIPQENFMKKVLVALALAGSSIALASPALADDPPPVPVTPGHHTMTTQDGPFPVTAALDCGPACFSYGDESARDEFRWAGDKWLDPKDGMWTLDGITFTNRNGHTGTLS
jgi:hypothetical protein